MVASGYCLDCVLVYRFQIERRGRVREDGECTHAASQYATLRPFVAVFSEMLQLGGGMMAHPPKSDWQALGAAVVLLQYASVI